MLETMDRPRVDVYKGPNRPDYHGWTFQQCEEQWNREKLYLHAGTFDGNLHRSLVNAFAEGRNEVVALDIGSGDAGLFRSFFALPTEESKVKQFLSYHPQMRLRLIGLTDVKSADKFNTTEILPGSDSPDDPDAQILAENIQYSITRAQTIEKFFQAHNVSAIDFASATFSLTYMHPIIFEEVLTTTIDHLQPNGKLVAVCYDAHVPGIKYDNDNTARLAIGLGSGTPHTPTAYKPGPRFKDVLTYRENIFRLKQPLRLIADKYIAYLNKFAAMKIINESEAFEVADRINEIVNSPLLNESTKREMLVNIDFRMQTAINNLVSRAEEKTTNKKMKILVDAAQRYNDTSFVDYGERTIIVKRVGENSDLEKEAEDGDKSKQSSVVA